jgi:hypothetical protein
MTSTRSPNRIPSALAFLGALTTSAALQAQAQSGGAAAKFQVHEMATIKGKQRLLFVDDASAYVAAFGAFGCLQSVSLSDCSIHPVVQGCPSVWIRDLVADDQHIAWTQALDPSVTPARLRGEKLLVCLKGNCVPGMLGPKAPFSVDQLALQNRTIFASFSTSASHGRKLRGSILVRTDFESSHFGKMETIAKTMAPIPSLATDRDALYYYVADEERAIRRMPLHGNRRPEILIKHADDVEGLIAGDDINASLELGRMESLGQPRHWVFHGIVAVDGESMYWSTGYIHSYNIRDKIVQTVRDPAGKPVPAGDHCTPDHDYFYYTNHMEASAIQRVSKSGGTPETVVSNQGQVGALVVSKDRLFWSSYDPNRDETRFRWIVLPQQP